MKPLRVVFLLIVAAAGLALALLSGRQSNEPRFEIVELGDANVSGDAGSEDPDRGTTMSASSRAIATDQVDYLAQLGPALGRTFWIGQGRDSETGDGTRDNPWRDLSTRLDQLRSGDRVVLLPGRYQGPFVLPAFDGDDPIELVGTRSPVLRNEDDAEAPVLRIEGKWHVVGVEVQPGETSTGVEIGSASGVQLRYLHINSGGRDGVVISEAARSVTILESHVHHVGGPQGVGIRIVEGARDLELIRNKVHATGLEPILLFEDGRLDRVARGQPGSRRAELSELGITIIEDPWEP